MPNATTQTPMDITKAKNALVNAQNEVQALMDGEVKARRFKGGALRGLATLDTWITEGLDKLDACTKPREKKARTKKADEPKKK